MPQKTLISTSSDFVNLAYSEGGKPASSCLIAGPENLKNKTLYPLFSFGWNWTKDGFPKYDPQWFEVLFTTGRVSFIFAVQLLG